jgi:hypothetical protein
LHEIDPVSLTLNRYQWTCPYIRADPLSLGDSSVFGILTSITLELGSINSTHYIGKYLIHLIK